MKKLLFYILLIGFFVCARAVHAENLATASTDTVPLFSSETVALREMFSYDARQPLLSSSDKIPDFSSNTETFSIRFTSVHGKEVSGILNIPRIGAPPYHCIIFVHDIGGGKEDMALLSDIAARNGMAVAAIDILSAPGADPRFPSSVVELRALMKQTIFDLRRLMDLLQLFRDFKIQSYTIAGVGFGGIESIFTTAADDRINSVITINSGGDWNSILNDAKYAFLHEKAFKESLFLNYKPEINQNADPANVLSGLGARPFLNIFDSYTSLFTDESTMALQTASSTKAELYFPFGNKSKNIGIVLKRMMFFIKDSIKENSISGTLPEDSEIVIGINNDDPKLPDIINVKDVWSTTTGEGGEKTLSLGAKIEGADISGTTLIGQIESAGMPIIFIQLKDDGKAGDLKQGDGIYSAQLDIPAGRFSDVQSVSIGGLGPNGEVVAGMNKAVDATKFDKR